MNESGRELEARPSPAGNGGAEVSGIDLLIALARHKWRVLGFSLLSAGIAALVSFIWPSTYTATTKIMPPQQAQSSAVAILGQLGAIGPVSAVRNPSEIFVAMLKSRTIGEALIKRFDLQKYYEKRYLVDARKAFERDVTVLATRDGVITIEVENRDAGRAMALANAYVEELDTLTLTLAVGEASQRRLFFEKQLRVVKDDLAKSDWALRDFRESTGLLQPDGQAGLTVQASAGLRAQITAKEIQLAAMRSFTTAQNPDYVRGQQEISSMRQQLAKLEKDPSQGKGDVLIGIDQAPQATFEHVKLVRDLKYQEALFELVAKQFEAAKIDEAKNATLIQILDPAVVPERRSWPRRTLIVSVTFLVSLLLAIAWVLLHEAHVRAKSDPAQASKLSELWRHFSSLK